MKFDFQAVLFDFDGTLADSYDAIAASVNHVRARRGHTALTVEEVKTYVGRGPEYLLEHTIPDCRLEDDIAAYRAHHPSVMVSLTRILPGAHELLALLRERGIKIGLCSNKPRIFSQALLEHLGVASLFDAVLGPEDVPRPKPAPDMLLAAVRRIGLNPAQVLYVGDMVVDVLTARAAGVPVWTVPTGSEAFAALCDAKPDRMLRDLEELVADLRSLWYASN
jgi:phosphoglycolate phosphatase